MQKLMFICGLSGVIVGLLRILFGAMQSNEDGGSGFVFGMGILVVSATVLIMCRVFGSEY